MTIIRKISVPISNGAVVATERVKEKKPEQVIAERIIALTNKRDYLVEKKKKMEARLDRVKDPELLDAMKTEILAVEKFIAWIDKRLEKLKKLETAVIQKTVPTKIISEIAKPVVEAKTEPLIEVV